MKKPLFSLIMVLLGMTLSFSAQAQLHLGAGLTFGTGISKLGLNFRGTFNIDDKFIAQPGVNFFIKDKPESGVSVNYFSVDLDASYQLISIGDNLTFFPVGGLNVFRSKLTTDRNFQGVMGSLSSDTKIGLNLGIGTKIETLTSLNYFGEFKVTVGGINQTKITAGVLYGF